jgi:hypothetical protein
MVNAEQLALDLIFPIDNKLVTKLNNHLANEATSKLASVVLFYEDQEPELYVRNSDTPEIVEGAYRPENGVNLKKTDYVVCVRWERPPKDPSWMIVNNKRVHMP